MASGEHARQTNPALALYLAENHQEHLEFVRSKLGWHYEDLARELVQQKSAELLSTYRYQVTHSPRALVYTALLNGVRQHLRNKKRTSIILDKIPLRDVLSPIDDLVDAREFLDTLAATLQPLYDRMKPSHEKLIRLHYAEQRRLSDIATLNNESRGAIYQRKKRILEAVVPRQWFPSLYDAFLAIGYDGHRTSDRIVQLAATGTEIESIATTLGIGSGTVKEQLRFVSTGLIHVAVSNPASRGGAE